MVVFRETKVVGRATGDTVLSAAVPIQAAYNASWSNIIEHMKLAGNARLLVPDAALDGIDELTDLPAEIVPYISGAGGAPTWLTPPQMPAWWIDQPQALAQQMDDIIGVHDVSRGEAPKNVQSGLGLSVLAEQDNTPLGKMVREFAQGWARFGSMCLEIYEDKVKESRTAAVKGGNSKIPSRVQWTGKSISGQTRASVPLDAMMPRSKVAMMAYARDLWDRQVINDPKMFARIADLPEQDMLIEDLDLDYARAERENHTMSIGEVAIPKDFDNHDTHIMVHNNFRKSTRYETLGPEMQMVFDLHVQAHETMAAEELAKLETKAATSPALAQAPNAQESHLTPAAAAAIASASAGSPFGAAGVPGGPQGAPGGAGGPAGLQMVPGTQLPKAAAPNQRGLDAKDKLFGPTGSTKPERWGYK